MIAFPWAAKLLPSLGKNNFFFGGHNSVVSMIPLLCAIIVVDLSIAANLHTAGVIILGNSNLS